jgi:prolyl oligopeptidase
VIFGHQVKSPVLVVQGTNDPRVLQVESDEMVEAIRSAGTYVDYLLFDNEGHGFSKKENRIAASNKYLEFLDTYLKN